VSAGTVDARIFIPLIPAIPVIALCFLPCGALDSEENTHGSDLLCIRYWALETTVVGHLDGRVGGNVSLHCGNFRPQKSENSETGMREKSENLEAGTRLARCLCLFFL
jgi:hypothetical protein